MGNIGWAAAVISMFAGSFGQFTKSNKTFGYFLKVLSHFDNLYQNHVLLARHTQQCLFPFFVRSSKKACRHEDMCACVDKQS